MRASYDLASIRHLYPFESRFIDRHGLRLHYVDQGSGDPLVMVHGNPSWSFLFRDLIRAVTPGSRAIAIDHLGCGLSDKPTDEEYDFRLRSRIDDLEALIEHLKIDRPITMVVHDWGGGIGMGWAVRNRSRIGRLIIMNTAAFPLPIGKPFPWPLWAFRSSCIGAFGVAHMNAFAEIAARTCTVRPLADDVRHGFLLPYDTPEHRLATLRFVQDIPLTPGDPSWNEIADTAAGLAAFRDVPTLVVWGRRDFIFDRAFFSEWRRRLPNAEMHSFADAGHYVLEDARDRILPLVLDFLARHPLSGRTATA